MTVTALPCPNHAPVAPGGCRTVCCCTRDIALGALGWWESGPTRWGSHVPGLPRNVFAEDALSELLANGDVAVREDRVTLTRAGIDALGALRTDPARWSRVLRAGYGV